MAWKTRTAAAAAPPHTHIDSKISNHSQSATYRDWLGLAPAMTPDTGTSKALALTGLILILLCGAWWTGSIKKNQLAAAQRTWVPPAGILGVDFLNNYHAARHWQNGGNPYTEKFHDPLDRPFVYSPVLLVLFGWCRLLTPRKAMVVWIICLALMAVVGAIASGQNRKRLRLYRLPLAFVVATVLWSMPVAFAMERGNCDLLVLMLIVPAVPLLSHPSWRHDLLAGICLALATWIKSYAGVLGLGLLAMRRPRAAACMALAYIAIGAVDLPDTLQHLTSMQRYVSTYDMRLHWSAHPFGVYWPKLWEGTWLAVVPGTLGAVAVLLPVVTWVSVNIWRIRQATDLILPYFAWLAGVGTFLAPVSNDYNLFFLPIAAVAVWDRRDRLAVHLLMALMLLWWQPLQLPIGHSLVFCFKLAGVMAIAMSLVARCREQGVEEKLEDVQHAAGLAA